MSMGCSIDVVVIIIIIVINTVIIAIRGIIMKVPTIITVTMIVMVICTRNCDWTPLKAPVMVAVIGYYHVLLVPVLVLVVAEALAPAALLLRRRLLLLLLRVSAGTLADR